MKTKLRFVKIYTSDDCSEYAWVQYIDAEHEVDFMLEFDQLLLKRSRKGVPWKCVLAYGIRRAAMGDPTLFRHPVKQAYVIGTQVYVFAETSPKKPKGHPLAIRYRHNFTRTLRQFDVMTKKQFIELYNATGCEIRLKPPVRHVRSGDGDVSRPQRVHAPTEREASKTSSLVGAKGRAKQAGLLGGAMGGPSPV